MLSCAWPLCHFVSGTSTCVAGYHGKGGPLKVASHKTMALTDLWLQAGREMGLQEVDPNGENVEGDYSWIPYLYV